MTMTKAITHTVSEVPGATRKSPRVYTHAIVAEYDRAAGEANCAGWAGRQARNDYEYHRERAAMPDEGGMFPGYSFNVSSVEVTKSREFLAANPDCDAYVAENVARVLETLPADGTPTVLQWSMSERAARNALGSLAKRNTSWRNLRVVPVIRAA